VTRRPVWVSTAASRPVRQPILLSEGVAATQKPRAEAGLPLPSGRVATTKKESPSVRISLPSPAVIALRTIAICAAPQLLEESGRVRALHLRNHPPPIDILAALRKRLVCRLRLGPQVVDNRIWRKLYCII
jgi:hypothetical protein